jgi:hypothetical protein
LKCIQDALEPDHECAILGDHAILISAFSTTGSSH